MSDLATEATTFDLERLCDFLERNQGALQIDRIVNGGFVGTRVAIRLQLPHRKPVVHEALRPDAIISGRELPSFANEIEQIVRHLKLAYPELDDDSNIERGRPPSPYVVSGKR